MYKASSSYFNLVDLFVCLFACLFACFFCYLFIYSAGEYVVMVSMLYYCVPLETLVICSSLRYVFSSTFLEME